MSRARWCSRKGEADRVYGVKILLHLHESDDMHYLFLSRVKEMFVRLMSSLPRSYTGCNSCWRNLIIIKRQSVLVNRALRQQ